MERHTYMWEEGKVYETRPSSFSWWVSLILSLAYCLALVIPMGITTSNKIVLMGTTPLLFIYSFWFAFRSTKWGLTAYWGREYLKKDFPKIRNGLRALQPGYKLGVVYTAWEKSDIEIRLAVEGTLKAICKSKAGKVFFYAAMTKGIRGDQERRLIESVFEKVSRESSLEDAEYIDSIELLTVKQLGEGKRHYLVEAIRKLMQMGGVDYYYLLDGDSIPEEKLIAEGARYLQRYQEIGGVTFDNKAYVQGSLLFLLYTTLRFIRRKMDLAFAATVLTGRGSLIRAEIFEDEMSLKYLNSHPIKYGKNVIMGYTGDDKTTVYLTWSKGFRSIFVPDVFVYAMEEPLPKRSWKNHWGERLLALIGLGDIVSIVRQEYRYSRNMQLGAQDLIRVRPQGVLPVAVKLMDQKYFYWSGIVGFFAMIVALPHYGMDVLHFYLFWTYIIRLIVTGIPALQYGYWHPLLPLVSYLNILQTVVKIISRANLDKASWSRGGMSVGAIDVLRPTCFILEIVAVLYLLTHWTA